jgi:hypothetical protein
MEYAKMNVNVTKYAVKFLESGSIEVILQSSNREMIAAQEAIVNPNSYNNNLYPTSVIISKSELPLFLACMRGESEFYPYFSDISYLLRVTPDGFKYIKLSGMNDGISGKYSEDTFYFPNKLSTGLHTRIESHISNPVVDVYEFSSTAISQFSGMVSPKIEWKYNHRTNGKWEYDKDHTYSGSKWIEWIERNIQDSIISGLNYILN